MQKLRRTSTDLDETTRAQSVQRLAAVMAAAVDLMLQTKNAHWNLRGPRALELDILCRSIHDEAEHWAELTAVRIRQLGGAPQVGAVAPVTTHPLDTDSTEADVYIDPLLVLLASISDESRRAAQQCERNGDVVTALLLTEILASADGKGWLIEAHSASQGLEAHLVSIEVPLWRSWTDVDEIEDLEKK